MANVEAVEGLPKKLPSSKLRATKIRKWADDVFRKFADSGADVVRVCTDHNEVTLDARHKKETQFARSHLAYYLDCDDILIIQRNWELFICKKETH